MQKKRTMIDQNSCDKIEKFSYMKPFTPDQLSEMKDELSSKVIEAGDLEAELSEIKKSYKDKIKPLKSRKRVLAVNIKNKALSVTEDCLVQFDREKGMAEIYDTDGIMVGSRVMTIEERQELTIPLRKTGTE